MCRKALLDRTLANLLREDNIGRDAVLFDESLDLAYVRYEESAPTSRLRLTMSRVFFARSLTNGRAIGGIRCDADTCPLSLFIKYGTDILV